jgi:hypothetical protein
VILYAELAYRNAPTEATIAKYKDLVYETAEYLADFAFQCFNKTTGVYNIGPPMATVPENTNHRTAFNPTFELSQWRTALRWAQAWRKRENLPRVAKWDKVLNGLAKLPEEGGCYIPQEAMNDSFGHWNWEHPSLIGPHGMLPGDGADLATSKATLKKVWEVWQFDRCWGWDFPMVAMAAAKVGEPEIAIEALLHPSPKNGMNAVGLSTGGPYPYFPSNGGLLYAIAMMAAGWDGAPEGVHAPGFPKDGQWVVQAEGLAKAP